MDNGKDSREKIRGKALCSVGSEGLLPAVAPHVPFSPSSTRAGQRHGLSIFFVSSPAFESLYLKSSIRK